MTKNQKRRGVTLIELLVVIGIFIILTAISVPLFNYFQKESDLNNSIQEAINTLRLAQNKTLASEGASNFGVHFETEKFILFEGTIYDPLDTDNKIHDLPKNVEIYEISLAGGGTEVVFERLTGETNQFGKVSLRLKSDFSETRAVGIEFSGKITLGEESPPGLLPEKDSRHVHIDYYRFIGTATEKLILTFDGGTKVEEIIIADYLSGGQIDWGGEIEVGGDDQKLIIHTHWLNDLVKGTQFCIHRDRRYNNKSLTITISDDPTGSLIEYSADGLTTTNTSFHADSDGPQWQ